MNSIYKIEKLRQKIFNNQQQIYIKKDMEIW